MTSINNSPQINPLVRRDRPGLFLLVLVLLFFGMFLIVAVCSSAISSAVGQGRSTVLIVTVLQNVMMFGLASCISAKLTMRHPWYFLGLSTPCKGIAVLGVFIAWLVSIPMLNGIVAWNEGLHLPDAMKDIETLLRSMEEANEAAANMLLDTSSVGGLLINILCVGILTGFCEELFFRGALQRAFCAFGVNTTGAIWCAALIFSAMHFQFFGFFPRLLMGAFFGYLLKWTDSIYPGAIAHALNNSVVVIITWLTTNGYTDFNFETFGLSGPWLTVSYIISAFLFVALLAMRKSFFTMPDFKPDHRKIS